MTEKKKKIAFHTLGCKLNFAETSTIARTFSENDFERVPASSKADVYIINTCSVTGAADRKCRQAIKKFMNQAPDAFIAVVGCYAQLRPGEIASIPGVDLVLGTNEKFSIAEYLTSVEKKRTAEVHSCSLSPGDQFNVSYSVGDRTRSFLKVQDGCDYSCSYCTIPMARGNSRNTGIAKITEEAKAIADSGIEEIVLTGVNTGDFGKSTGELFIDLLHELANIDKIKRIRISSIEPNLLTDEIIQMAALNNKLLPHFHIPLQSGCNRILGLMRRRYQREVFASRVTTIRKMIPLAGIGADVIVGFPGETEEDFQDTFSFISSLPLSYLHVFPYSDRPGTVSYDLPGKVSDSIREERSKKLTALSRIKNSEFIAENIGMQSSVLFEKTRSEGFITGFTANYLKAEYPWDPRLANTIRKVIIKGLSSNGRVEVEITE